MSNIDDEIKCVVVGDGAVYFSISPSGWKNMPSD